MTDTTSPPPALPEPGQSIGQSIGPPAGRKVQCVARDLRTQPGRADARRLAGSAL